MIITSFFKNPAIEDLDYLYKKFGDAEFIVKDVNKDDLNMCMRCLSDRKIVLKLRRMDNDTGGSWVYRINPSFVYKLKRGEMPSIGKV